MYNELTEALKISLFRDLAIFSHFTEDENKAWLNPIWFNSFFSKHLKHLLLSLATVLNANWCRQIHPTGDLFFNRKSNSHLF